MTSTLIPLPRVVRPLAADDSLPEPSTLPPGGYCLRRAEDGTVSLSAADEEGERHAAATLAQLAGEEAVYILDWPGVALRGVIEGFYGEPWTHEQRLDLLRFAESVKLNAYVYAPKDDPYHRADWRTPYPVADLERLRELVVAAVSHGIDFVYALHPALSMRFSDDAEHALLAAKAEQLWSIGIRSIALLFDDVEPELGHPADSAAFAGSLGAAHGTTCARFARDFLEPHGVTAPLLMVPTEYAGVEQSPYRADLAATLPDHALVWWTGPDIVVGAIGRPDIDAASVALGRDLLLWDNFPVNDFDRTRAFLGPLTGRTTDLAGSAVRGITANPMVEYEPSLFALATVADWAWNTAAYDERRSAAAALQLVGGTDAPALAPLVAALSSWPPSAPQYPGLATMLDAALRGAGTAPLRSTLAALAAVDSVSRPGLQPWIDAGAAMGAAGLAALDLLEHGGSTAAGVLGLLDAAEAHTAAVARDCVPPFVREVLARAGR